MQKITPTKSQWVMYLATQDAHLLNSVLFNLFYLGIYFDFDFLQENTNWRSSCRSVPSGDSFGRDSSRPTEHSWRSSYKPRPSGDRTGHSSGSGSSYGPTDSVRRSGPSHLSGVHSPGISSFGPTYYYVSNGSAFIKPQPDLSR